MPYNICTSYYSVCLSISAAYTIASNSVVSAVAISFNSVSFITRPFAKYLSSLITLIFILISYLLIYILLLKILI